MPSFAQGTLCYGVFTYWRLANGSQWNVASRCPRKMASGVTGVGGVVGIVSQSDMSSFVTTFTPAPSEALARDDASLCLTMQVL